LRRINLVKRLLIILQRGDVEILVVEKLVNLLALMLKDGFLPVELNTVADFVVMTFEPLGMMRGGNPNMAHEPMSTQVQMGSQWLFHSTTAFCFLLSYSLILLVMSL
jgi:hypothetical protein